MARGTSWANATNEDVFEAVIEHLFDAEDDVDEMLALELAIRLGVNGFQGLRTTNEWHPAAERLRQHAAMWDEAGLGGAR